MDLYGRPSLETTRRRELCGTLRALRKGIRSRKRDTLSAKFAKYRKARKAVSSQYRLVKTSSATPWAPLLLMRSLDERGAPTEVCVIRTSFTLCYQDILYTFITLAVA